MASDLLIFPFIYSHAGGYYYGLFYTELHLLSFFFLFLNENVLYLEGAKDIFIVELQSRTSFYLLFTVLILKLVYLLCYNLFTEKYYTFFVT